jgi:ATP-dependent helicase/nuclease subunit B
MGLRLVLGRAGMGKSRFCRQEIAAELRKNPAGFPLLYIVPEQATFQAEYALFAASGLGGAMRAQVLSFRRLAWKVLQEVGGGKRLFIDDLGKGMVLRKVLEKHRSELRVFKHAGEQGGVLENLVELSNELKRAGITVSQFKQTYDQRVKAGKDLPALFKEKVSDLLLILAAAAGELGDQYLDAEDYLDLLAVQAAHSSLLKGAALWVDGFDHFTNQEYAVLTELFKFSRGVTVSLCLDRERSPGEQPDELDPFYPTALTYQKLLHLAKACRVPVEKIFLREPQRSRFYGRPGLAHLERNLFHYPVKAYRGKPGSLYLAAAPNRRCEVESLAREIIRRVRDEGYRWRDMAVISSSLDDYRDIVATIFSDYDIPFFLDQKRSVIHHPLVEFIRSALEIINRNWRYSAVFRCFKTEFLFPLTRDKTVQQKWRERTDQLENYVLAFGIQGGLWRSVEPWRFLARDTLDSPEEQTEEGKLSSGEAAYLQLLQITRQKLSGPLLRLEEKFKAAKTVKEKTAALYELLTEAGAWERLELWSRDALERGDPERAREHLQVYKGVIALFDQLVEIMGEEKIPGALYARLVETGLESLRLGLVPPSLDQVFVGDLERSRPGPVKFAYLLGANDGLLPAPPREDGIFSDEEREIAGGWGLELGAGGRRRLLDEQFLIYMALTRTTDGLWVSYPLADEEGRALLPSLLIMHLKELFPFLKEELLAMEPCSGDAADGAGAPERDAEVLLSYVAHPRRTLSHLAVQLSRWKKGTALHPFWWDVYNWYAAEKTWRAEAGKLLGGVFYRNREEPLRAATSRLLYGSQLQASVSRLETFRACPFAHFVTYGLRLRERPVYRLEAPDIGRFFHAVLRNFTLFLQEKGLAWGELSKEGCLQLVAAEVERLAPKLQQEILLSSGRYRYLAGKLKDTVGEAALILGEQDRCSSFKPVGVELFFGSGGALPGVGLELDDGCRMELIGRIDRVDLAYDQEGRAYIRVIDYKSGRTGFNLAEVYHGLALQLFTYLDVVLLYAPEWLQVEALPGGILYFRVHAPLIRAPRLLPPEEIEKEIRKRYKMKGMILQDVEVARLMDSSLQTGHSAIIPVGLTKEGGFYRNSVTFNAERYTLLREYLRRLIKTTAQAITRGEVAITPYRLGKNKACTYCPHRAICQFDLALAENDYRLLKNEPAEKIWPELEKG